MTLAGAVSDVVGVVVAVAGGGVDGGAGYGKDTYKYQYCSSCTNAA